MKLKLFRESESELHVLKQIKQFIRLLMNDTQRYQNVAYIFYLQDKFGHVSYFDILETFYAMRQIQDQASQENRTPTAEEFEQITKLAERAEQLSHAYLQDFLNLELITHPDDRHPQLKEEIDHYLKQKLTHESSLTDFEILHRTYDTQDVDVQRSERGVLINQVITTLAEHQTNNPVLEVFFACKNVLDAANSASKALEQLQNLQQNVEYTHGTRADVEETIEDSMNEQMRIQLNQELYLAQLQALQAAAKSLNTLLQEDKSNKKLCKQLNFIENLLESEIGSQLQRGGSKKTY